VVLAEDREKGRERELTCSGVVGVGVDKQDASQSEEHRADELGFMTHFRRTG
jgi:hypothetical protein